MIPLPLEELRRFILAEYPSLNDMNHPHYKAGELMSAVLRWWTDEHLPAINKIQENNKYLWSQNDDLIKNCVSLRNRVWAAEGKVRDLDVTLAEIKRLADVLIGPHGKEHYEAEQRLMHLLNPVIGVSANGLAVWNEKFELIDPGSYELVVTPEYDERNPIWISEMVLILGAERFIDSMKRYPGRKIRVLEKDLNRIVEVYPETVKIPYLGNLMPNCRCVPAGCQVNVGAGGYVGVRKLFHAKE